MTRSSAAGVRVHVILSTPQKNLLLLLARKTGITVSEHLRRAVDVYLSSSIKPK